VQLTLPLDDHRTLALALTRSLLAQESLNGWTVVVNARMTSRFGLCKYHTKEIHLAAWLVDDAPWFEIEDTIRHELAHAAVGMRHGHDEAWKRAAHRLGARPERCGSGSVWNEHAPAARRPAKWLVICDACRVRFQRQRRPRGRLTHAQCGQVVRWVTNPEGAA